MPLLLVGNTPYSLLSLTDSKIYIQHGLRITHLNSRPLDFPSILTIPFASLSLGNFLWDDREEEIIGWILIIRANKKWNTFCLCFQVYHCCLLMLIALFQPWLFLCAYSFMLSDPTNHSFTEVCAPTRKPGSDFSCSRKANKKQGEVFIFFCGTNTLAQTGKF